MLKKFFKHFTLAFWKEKKQEKTARDFVPKIFKKGIPKSTNAFRAMMQELNIPPKIFLNAVISEINERIKAENRRLEIFINASQKSKENKPMILKKMSEINKLERLKQYAMALKSELGIED